MDKKKGGGPPPKRTGGLGDLGKALREAGLLSEEKAKKLAHEERVRKKEIGRDQVEEEKRRHEAELERAAQERRAEIRAAQERHVGESDAARAVRLIREGALSPAGGRPKRFHFVAASGKIPFLEVDDEAARQLFQGSAGIVEVPGGTGREHAVVSGKDRLNEIERIAPASIRFWNRPRDSRPRAESPPAAPPATEPATPAAEPPAE